MQTSRQVLSFYLDDTLRMQQSNSEHGEIPEVFRKYQLVLAIAGRNWTTQDGWRPSPLKAIVDLCRVGENEYVTLGETEVIYGENDPQFTRHFEVEALTMSDSQYVARHTMVRIRALSQGEEIGHAEVSVAQLVWNLRYEGTLIKTPAVDDTTPKSASLKVIVVRGPIKGEKLDNHMLEMRVGINVPSEMTGHKIRISACAAGEQGGEWCRAAVGDARMRPCGGRIARLRTVRDGLNGYHGETRSIRLEAIAMRKGVAHVLGFCQFQLPQLETHKWLEWRVAGGNGDAEVIAVHNMTTTPSITRVVLEIGGNQAGLPKGPTGLKSSQYTRSNSWSWCNWSIRSRVSLTKTDQTNQIGTQSQFYKTISKELSPPSYSVRFPEEQTTSQGKSSTNQLNGQN